MYLRPMLDEILTVEERAVVARARAFAEEQVAPNAARWEWDRHYPLETIKAGCAQGFNTIELAKKHGGQGLSFSCKLRAFEEIAKADFAFAFWGGDFYIFLQRVNDDSTNVYRLSRDFRVFETALGNTKRHIVGAGVSSCAPVGLDR